MAHNWDTRKPGTVEAIEADAVAAAERRREYLLIDPRRRLAEGFGFEAVALITRTALITHVFMSGLGLPNAVPGVLLLLKPFREGDLMRAIAHANPRNCLVTGRHLRLLPRPDDSPARWRVAGLKAVLFLQVD